MTGARRLRWIEAPCQGWRAGGDLRRTSASWSATDGVVLGREFANGVVRQAASLPPQPRRHATYAVAAYLATSEAHA